MNLAACAGLPKRPENGTWFRAIDPRHLPAALNSAHTAAVRSRFNAGPLLPVPDRFEILYFAEDPVVAVFETEVMLGPAWKPGVPIPHPRKTSYVTIHIDIVLDDVVDLTDVTNAQQPLQTSAQELTGDWDCYGIRTPVMSVSAPTGVTPTQELGQELYRTSSIEAFRTISAKVPYARNLVVFPQKLSSRSSLIYRDPTNPSGPPLLRLP